MARYAIGREATLTWTQGNAPESNVITANFNRVSYQIVRKHYLTVPPGYLGERYTSGILACAGYFGNWYDSADNLPSIPGGNAAPDGDSGTLTILMASGHSLALPVIITALAWDISMEDGGPPQMYQYRFVMSMQGAGAPFTVTG